MVEKSIDVVEKKTMYLYDQHDLDKRKGELLKSIDTLIDYLSKQKDKIRKFAVEDVASLSKFKSELEDGDEYSEWGLFIDILEDIGRLNHVAWNIQQQEHYSNEIDKRYFLFTK